MLAARNEPAPAAATQSRERIADHPNITADTMNSHHPSLRRNAFDIGSSFQVCAVRAPIGLNGTQLGSVVNKASRLHSQLSDADRDIAHQTATRTAPDVGIGQLDQIRATARMAVTEAIHAIGRVPLGLGMPS